MFLCIMCIQSFHHAEIGGSAYIHDYIFSSEEIGSSETEIQVIKSNSSEIN